MSEKVITHLKEWQFMIAILAALFVGMWRFAIPVAEIRSDVALIKYRLDQIDTLDRFYGKDWTREKAIIDIRFKGVERRMEKLENP